MDKKILKMIVEDKITAAEISLSDKEACIFLGLAKEIFCIHDGLFVDPLNPPKKTILHGYLLLAFSTVLYRPMIELAAHRRLRQEKYNYELVKTQKDYLLSINPLNTTYEHQKTR